jgi:DNA-binding NarL/FixJ family response regulator
MKTKSTEGMRASSFRWNSEDFAVISYSLPCSGSAVELTAAEREVLELVLLGESNAGIAHCRKRSQRTVANQVAAILRKLGLSSRNELAWRWGQR